MFGRWEEGCNFVQNPLKNRNWAYEYGGLGQSSNPCSDTFSGSGPASEVEVANVQNFILANKDRIKYYNDLHSAASMVLFPWGYSPQVQYWARNYYFPWVA